MDRIYALFTHLNFVVVVAINNICLVSHSMRGGGGALHSLTSFLMVFFSKTLVDVLFVFKYLYCKC